MVGSDFICIGAAKAGTTWLHRVLNNHPQVELPDFKEVHYFDQVQIGQKHRLNTYKNMIIKSRVPSTA